MLCRRTGFPAETALARHGGVGGQACCPATSHDVADISSCVCNTAANEDITEFVHSIDAIEINE